MRTSTHTLSRIHRAIDPRWIAIALGLVFAGGIANAQSLTNNLGYLDNDIYERGTLTRSQPAVHYWFYLRHSEMTVLANVQDFGGRGIDQATIYDADGKVKADSRNRIGAAIGARDLGVGWHRLYIRSTKDNHQYGVTLKPERVGEPGDVGNNFNTAHDLGVAGDGGQSHYNRVGTGDSADFYRFRLTRSLNHLDISLLEARRNGAHLELYRLNGNQTQIVSRASANGGNQPLISERVDPGTYFARVTPTSGATGAQGTSYRIYVRGLELDPDPAGDLQNPFIIRRIPTRRPFSESVTPRIDGGDAFRFTVPTGGPGGRLNVRVGVSGSNSNFAIYLLDASANNFLGNNTERGAAQKFIARSLAAGNYHVFIITQGTEKVSYQLTVESQTLPNTQPTPPAPTIQKISYGGLLYDNHSPFTTMSPTSIPVGGAFQITSSSMSFAGPNTELRVVLEIQNRRPGSFGVTRLRLTGVTVSGNTLTVQGPDQPIYGNQQYRVVVVTFTNRRPDSYASPGLLTVN